MEKIVLALGYFDSVHLGHRMIIDTVKQDAKSLGAIPAVFTFSLNPSKVLFNSGKSVYTLSERTEILNGLGIEKIISVTPTTDFLNLSGEKFLQGILKDYEIAEVVCGTDFRCGHGAEFNANDVKKFFEARNITVKILDLLEINGVKISTSLISTKIIEGNLIDANEMLGDYYRVKGVVVHGRARGRTLGIRTANIISDSEKYSLKNGVYATYVKAKGLTYKAVTNVGVRPTFNEFDVNLESFLIDFDGDLYSEEITVFFVKKIRDIIAFSSKESLIEEIKRNIDTARTLL